MSDGMIVVRSRNRVTRLPVRHIYYVESNAHDMVFHSEFGEHKDIYTTMKRVESALYPFGFRRCNVSYLVNLRYCKSMTTTSVSVAGTELTVSRQKKRAFAEAFESYNCSCTKLDRRKKE